MATVFMTGASLCVTTITDPTNGEVSGDLWAGRRVAPVRRPEVLLGPLGDDPRRVDLLMGHVVVALDVVEVDRVGDARLLVEVAQVAREVLVIGDAPQVALEV